MAEDDVKPELGRIRDRGRARSVSHTTKAMRIAGRAGAKALRRRNHLSPYTTRRGTGAGVRAAAGLIGRGSRRVVVKARYATIKGGDLGAARAHLYYILRDGVTRSGDRGRLYNATEDDVDPAAFGDRSVHDPHQFRFIVAPEDSARLETLKPFIRDLVAQMQRDLDTRLDWVAVDHFNTGRPHTHLVVRGRDLGGRDLVIARDYISHGVRARAQALITLELGPETEIERLQKLTNEVSQERLTRLDRSLLRRAKGNILYVRASEGAHPQQRSSHIGRLRTLERLGLAAERQPGVWQLDAALSPKLRQLGQRADTFKMMQRALREAGIERGAAALAVFDRGSRKAPLIGQVVGAGMIDEITDRTWVMIDALDGRIHYAELGRLAPSTVPAQGMIVALKSDRLKAGPATTPHLDILSNVRLTDLPTYNGPTWLDQALTMPQLVDDHLRGFAAELQDALQARAEWLIREGFGRRLPFGAFQRDPQLTAIMHRRETERLARSLADRLEAAYVPLEPGTTIAGIYQRSILTPTRRLAVIRRDDIFTLAPWRPSLEPFRGRKVIGVIGRGQVRWSLDRGRSRSAI